MNNTAKNTIIALLVIIVLILGYMALKPRNPEPVSTTSGSTSTQPSQTVSVAGMQQYTDSTFGFSFWYPDTWTVTVPSNPPFGARLEAVSVVKELGLQPAGQNYPSIIIQEAHSTTRSIVDTGGAGPIGSITYHFDITSHLWMVSSDEFPTYKPADISNNSMGGLHLFSGTSRFDTKIIPLSADNFVVIGNGGAANSDTVANTVVATDPSVATPVSAAQQIQTIEDEKAKIEPH